MCGITSLHFYPHIPLVWLLLQEQKKPISIASGLAHMHAPSPLALLLGHLANKHPTLEPGHSPGQMQSHHLQRFPLSMSSNRMHRDEWLAIANNNAFGYKITTAPPAAAPQNGYTGCDVCRCCIRFGGGGNATLPADGNVPGVCGYLHSIVVIAVMKGLGGRRAGNRQPVND